MLTFTFNVRNIVTKEFIFKIMTYVNGSDNEWNDNYEVNVYLTGLVLKGISSLYTDISIFLHR